MEKAKLLMQCLSLLMLTIIALILCQLRNRNDATAPKLETHAVIPAAWKYLDFQFNEPDKYHTRLIAYHTDEQTFQSSPVETNRVTSAEDIFDRIGSDGWEFVWSDGKSFLVRRPEGKWKHSYFLVETQEQK